MPAAVNCVEDQGRYRLIVKLFSLPDLAGRKNNSFSAEICEEALESVMDRGM